MEENLADMVKRHRKASGLSRNQLAEVAGVGKTVIYDLEHGRENLRLSTLKKILNALNIHMVYVSPLSGGDNEKS